MNKPKKAIRIYFEDRGQDFLWWDLEPLGESMYRVTDAGPFQSSVWTGRYILNGIDVGRKVQFSRGPDDPILTLNYPIEKIDLNIAEAPC